MENFIYIITGVVAIAVFLYYSIKPANSGTTFHYPQEHLQEIKHKIAFYPINEQVQCAQTAVKSKIDDHSFIKAYLDSAELDTMGDFTIETIGNLAYIALFYKGRECRESANSYLSAYKAWIKINFPSDYEKYVQDHGNSRN